DARKIMDLLMKLEQLASEAVGYVHALIGNHEAMNLFGDLRYVAPADYESFRTDESEKLRDDAYKASGGNGDEALRKKWDLEHPVGYFERQALFGPQGLYGKWIRSHNTAIRIDDSLFVHGGINLKYADYNLKKMNDRVREE